jgi:hypothetical protein
MDYFAGLDVSVKETSICIVDDTGKIVNVASEPQALLAVLKNPAYHFGRSWRSQPRPPDLSEIDHHRAKPRHGGVRF